MSPSERTYPPLAPIHREAEAGAFCHLLLSGLATRSRIVAGGARQITGLGAAGELLDPASLVLGAQRQHIHALTVCTVRLVPRDALRARLKRDGELSLALLALALRELTIAQEWLANVGRRRALSRLLHFLCEMRYRLGDGSPRDGETLALPLTQAQMADILGLTPVHLNRLLRELELRGILRRGNAGLTILDWSQTCREGNFSPGYLECPEPLREGRLLQLLDGG